MARNLFTIAARHGGVFLEDTEATTAKVKSSPETKAKLLFAFEKELGQFRVVLTDKTVRHLINDKTSISNLLNAYQTIIPMLKDRYHEAGESFTPFYPGFPKQVIEMSVEEMRMDQLYSYYLAITDPSKVADFIEFNRIKFHGEIPVEDTTSLVRPIEEFDGYTLEDMLKIADRHCESGTVLSNEDLEELVWFIQNYPDHEYPSISVKETLARVMDVTDIVPKDINDVLRYSIFKMFGTTVIGGVPKKIFKIEKIKYRSRFVKADNPEYYRKVDSGFTRSVRKKIVSLIDAVVSAKGLEHCVEDAKLGKNHWAWRRVEKSLHVRSEFKKKFPHAWEFMDTIMNSEKFKKIVTWNSKLQGMLKEAFKGIPYNSKVTDTSKYLDSIKRICDFMKSRPGVFIRAFDSLFRREWANKSSMDTYEEFLKKSHVMNTFINLEGVNNKTLLELLDFYSKRDVKINRFWIKHGVGADQRISIPTVIDPLPQVLCFEIQKQGLSAVINNIIRRGKADHQETGKSVYISEDLKNLPFALKMKNASGYPSGTIFEIPKGQKIVRWFCHWIDDYGCLDYDLHAYLYKENADGPVNSSSCASLGWDSNNKLNGGSFVYSGDVRQRVGKCSEYVDLNIQDAVKHGYRYGLILTHDFNRSGDKIWSGFQYPTSMGPASKIWNPATPFMMEKVDTLCQSDTILSFVVDFKEGTIKYIGQEINSGCYSKTAYLAENLNNLADIGSRFPGMAYRITKAYYESRGYTILTEEPKKPEEGATKEEIEKYESIKRLKFDYMLKNMSELQSYIGA